MKLWRIAEQNKELQKHLSHALNISPLIAQILLNRNVNNVSAAKRFLEPGNWGLHDPYLLKGIDRTVLRINQAIDNKEKILVHGDYDVDGVCGTALLLIVLRELGAKVEYFIPNRLIEGYGLGMAGVQYAKKLGTHLLITVDCGITSCEEIKLLNKLKVDSIIIDHHQPSKNLPDAFSIIDPLQKGCKYPDSSLSGVALAFKLCEALFGTKSHQRLYPHLDLVALGTISDIVPLIGENRFFARQGLKELSRTSKIGLEALIEVSRIINRELNSYDIAFILGPRINATGRLGVSDVALRLLLSTDKEEASELATQLDRENKRRQRIESATLREAIEKLEKEINFKEHKVIVLCQEDWHPGVIGIVASKLAERYYRPTIMISMKDGLGKGSGRSIENFHLFEALSNCESLLRGFGGHKFACGLTILKENLNKFIDTINQFASSCLTPEDLIPKLNIDALVSFKDLDFKLLKEIQSLEPFGQSNPAPIFASKNLRLKRPEQIVGNGHLKLIVTDGKVGFEAMGFRMSEDNSIRNLLKSKERFDLAYTVELNDWQGISSIQLNIEDIRPASRSFQP